MRFLTLFGRGRSGDIAENRLARFRKVLTSAQQIPRYHACLRRANLDSSRAIAALPDINEALRHFAVLDTGEFCRSRGSVAARAPLPPPQKFIGPASGPAHTAVFGGGFEEKNGVRLFHNDSFTLLEEYRPEVVAAPVSVLRRLAASMRNGSARIPPLKSAVVAFTSLEETLNFEDRDEFWRTFQVPLFEQFVGLDGRVIARECEIHEGLHLIEEHAVIERHVREELLLTSLTDLRHPTLRLATGYTGGIETMLCDCGRAEPRLTAIKSVRREPELSRQAVA